MNEKDYKQFTIRISNDYNDYLEELKETTGIPRATLIRLMIKHCKDSSFTIETHSK